MPVRAVHHGLSPVRLASRGLSAGWERMRSSLRPAPAPRLPIPLMLPCEIFDLVVQQLPPEAVVRLICSCRYLRGLYCENGSDVTNGLWEALLRRTFPTRFTGAPGPNSPTLKKCSSRDAVAAYAREWVPYHRALRASPRVTGVQIAKFVRWAASAHSWYKHLPLQDAAVFSFVLD